MTEPKRRVVIAGGSGHLGRALALAVGADERFEVRALSSRAGPALEAGGWRCDLTSIADAEVALAGADTVVFLARTTTPRARLLQGALADLDALMADSVSRAATRVGARHLVFFACGPNDPREVMLRNSGVPMSVLHGGGDDPVKALLDLVASASGAPQEKKLSEWSSGEPALAVSPMGSCVISIQRFERPLTATAEALARAYFEWLPSAAPLVRVEHVELTWQIIVLGTPMLALRLNPGRSEPDCHVLEVVGGALVAAASAAGPTPRFEFRVLRDSSMVVALIDFAPSMPWPLYRVQASVHARVMRLYGQALESKTLVPA